MLTDFAQSITSKWWTFLVRGILALVLAVAVFMYPGATIITVTYLIAFYFIVSGIAQIAGGFALAGAGHWWLLILTGALTAILGFIMIGSPGLGPLALAYMVAMYAMYTGLIEIASGIQLRGALPSAGWWIVFGVLTLALGIYVVVQPGIGLAALVYTIGFYAAIAGIVLVAFAFRLKSVGAQLAGGVRAS